MAYKIRILGMLMATLSFGTLITSLFTFKWYVDTNTEIGIFGFCIYSNASNTNRMLTIESNATSNYSAVAHNLSVANNFSVTKRDLEEFQDYIPTAHLFDLFTGGLVEPKCFQLLWPDTEEADRYLSGK